MTRKQKIKKAKFVNELYLFSNKLQPDAENWFKSSLVEHIDLRNFDSEQLEICFLLNDLLQASGKNYRYALRVINYKSKALSLVKLSGIFEAAFRVDAQHTYKDLVKCHRALYRAHQGYIALNEALSSVSAIQRDSSFMKNALLKDNLKSLRLNLKNQDALFQASISNLEKSFYSTFIC